jgi:hypothetical protein
MVKLERRFRPDADNPLPGTPIADVDTPADPALVAWAKADFKARMDVTPPRSPQPSDPLGLPR